MTGDPLTPAQCFAARQALRWTRKAFAARLGVPADAIRAFEVECRGLAEIDLQKARNTLETAGVEFIAENGGGAGVRLRKGAYTNVTAEEIKQARKLLGWSQLDLALEARISLSTVSNFEVVKTPLTPRVFGMIRATLEAAGVEFITENDGGAGVRLRKVGPVAT